MFSGGSRLPCSHIRKGELKHTTVDRIICITSGGTLDFAGGTPVENHSFISFSFIFLYLTTVASLICLDCFVGGRAKKLHNQKFKTYFTIILTDITEITIFLTEIKQIK